MLLSVMIDVATDLAVVAFETVRYVDVGSVASKLLEIGPGASRWAVWAFAILATPIHIGSLNNQNLK